MCNISAKHNILTGHIYLESTLDEEWIQRGNVVMRRVCADASSCIQDMVLF